MGECRIAQSTGGAIQMQHSAAGPLFGGKLGDELRGKNEIEIVNFHSGYYTRRHRAILWL